MDSTKNCETLSDTLAGGVQWRARRSDVYPAPAPTSARIARLLQKWDRSRAWGIVIAIGGAGTVLAEQRAMAEPGETSNAVLCVGLDSQRLSATGISAVSAASLLSSGLNQPRLDALRLAEASLAAAHRAVTAAEHAIAVAGATPVRSESLAATRAALAGTVAARDAQLIAARAHVVAALTNSIGAEAGALAQRAMATVGRDLPPEWCFFDTSQDGLATLEQATRKARLGRELTQAEATAVAAAESSPIVRLARERIEANAAAIREVFSQAQSLPPAP